MAGLPPPGACLLPPSASSSRTQHPLACASLAQFLQGRNDAARAGFQGMHPLAAPTSALALCTPDRQRSAADQAWHLTCGSKLWGPTPGRGTCTAREQGGRLISCERACNAGCKVRAWKPGPANLEP